MPVKKEVPVYFQCPAENGDTAALQAVARGEASADQQRRAMDWIINVACFTYQDTFFPGEPDAAAFAAGRRFVGNRIVTQLKINLSALTQAKGANNG